MNSEFDEHLARGVALFNGHAFYEAHEAWEIGWLAEAGDARLLLQGLIQVAAAFVKLGREEPVGAVKLLAEAEPKLRAFVGQGHGVDLETLLAEVAGWKARLADSPEHPFAAKDLPTLGFTPPAGG